MDKSQVGCAIEKIKRQEQNKEASLKAKREYETAVATKERSIREALAQIDKYKQEHQELLKKTDDLRVQLTIQKIRRDALAAQLVASTKELEELHYKLVEKRAEVRDVRSTYCDMVQGVSDECDIWALLMKPMPTEPMSRPLKKSSESSDVVRQNESRLRSALERRDKALAERDRLKAEPDAGEEFVRIRNALRYSMEMTANFRK